ELEATRHHGTPRAARHAGRTLRYLARALTGTRSDESELSSDFLEGPHRQVEVIARVCGRDLTPHARLSCGTTGKPNPVTNTPSPSNKSLIWIAAAVSPTMIGMIGVS